MSMTPHTPLIEALKEDELVVRMQNLALAVGLRGAITHTNADRELDQDVAAILKEAASRIATETTEPDAVQEDWQIVYDWFCENCSEPNPETGEAFASSAREAVAALCKLMPPYQSPDAQTMRDALIWISKIATQAYEQDDSLRSDSARTVRRLAEKADEALAAQSSPSVQSIRAEAFKQAGDFIEDIVGAFKNEDARRKVATAIRSLGDRG